MKTLLSLPRGRRHLAEPRKTGVSDCLCLLVCWFIFSWQLVWILEAQQVVSELRATLGLFGGIDQLGSSSRASIGDKGGIFVVKFLSFSSWIYFLVCSAIVLVL